MWTVSYIFSQIFAILGFIALGSTFLIKNKKAILILNIVSSVCLAIQYLFLKAYAGMISNCILIVATIWFFVNEKLNRKKDLISIITVSIMYLVFGILTYQGWVDIVVIVASISFTYAIWQPNVKVYRIIGLFVSLFWLTYDIFYFTLMQMIADVIMLICKISGLIKLKFENKKLEEEKPQQ